MVDKERAREDLMSMRREHQDLADGIVREGRRELRLLDEQIMLLGSSCPDRLYAVRERVLSSLMRMDRSFAEYDDDFGKWLGE
ncbi:MAG: hypothetical protein IKF78_12095 [Atopobiaceae bacterium]|nr:hypothetical protein [Atopobiaceae bacterium]